MLYGQKIVVVMPAYNAARTLQRTYDEVMQQGIVDLAQPFAERREIFELKRHLDERIAGVSVETGRHKNQARIERDQ